MGASLRVLIASAWLGVAGASVASAQSDPLASGSNPEGCGPICQFFGGRSPAPADTLQPQTQEQPEADRQQTRRGRVSRRAQAREAAAGTDETRAERRSRPRAAEKARPKSGAPARRAPAPAPEDVEETASVAQTPDEILFVSGADEAHRAIAGDLADILGPDLPLRTIPGKGLPLRDVLSLPGADVTVTSSLTMARGAAYSEKIVYLTKLFPEELHALAGPGVRRLEDLEGKTVHLGPPDSDSEAAARTFLQSRGLTVTPAGGSFASAVAGVREGRIAAAFILAPKPFAPLGELRAVDGLRFLPLAYRSSDTAFHPAALSGTDYPGLIAAGERVETIALDAILVAPRWRENTPRQQELAAFTTRLFERLGALGEGRHPKWKDTNLATGVEGFWRLKSAGQWVAARLKQRQAAPAALPREARTGEAR